MRQTENPGAQDEEALGTGELHLLLTRSCDILVSASELEEALRCEEEPDFRRYLPEYRYRTRKLPDYVCALRQANLNVDLKLHFHLLRKSVRLNPFPADLEKGLEGLYDREYRHVCMGILQIRGQRVLFNGVELSGDAFEKWLGVCLQVFWRRDASLTPEQVTELAKLIGTHLREVELKSLETLRRTLGDDVAERLLRDGKITVRSLRGEEYLITDSAEVYHRSPNWLRHVCVQVEGEEKLPKYDLVLAKYLVIRDRPELIRDREGRLHGIDGAYRQLLDEE